MAIMALRAGGIANVDGSLQATAPADHGQGLPDAGAAQLVLSGPGATGGQISAPAFSQATPPLFLRADSATGAATDFHSDQSSTVAAGATVPNFSSAGATITMISGPIFNTTDHAGDPGVTITLADNSALPADGWFIVPSAANEYGDAVYAAADGFGFDVATGDFASDWVFIA